MRSISRHDDIIEFKDTKDSLIIFKCLDSITWFYDSKTDSNEMLINKDDYLLFYELRKIFNTIKDSTVIEPKKIHVSDSVCVDDSKEMLDGYNSFIISPVDEDTLKLTFVFRNKGYRSVEIKMDTKKTHNYAPYDKLFVDMFDRLYTIDNPYQMNMEECEYVLRKKKN